MPVEARFRLAMNIRLFRLSCGWIEIQSSTMAIDRGLEMLDVAEAASGLFDPLDCGSDRF